MKNFEFDTFTNEATKKAWEDIRPINLELDYLKMRAEFDACGANEKFWHAVESYFISKGMIKVDPYNHDAGFRYNKKDRAYYYHACTNENEHSAHDDTLLAKIDEHPELIKYYEEHEAWKNEMLASVERKVDKLAADKQAAWDVIHNHLAEKGLLSKNKEGQWPELLLKGRIVSLASDEMPSFGFLGDLGKALQGFVKDRK